MRKNGTPLLRLAVAQQRVNNGEMPPLDLDLTGGAPSLIRGKYDLSIFSQSFSAAAEIAEPMLGRILGQGHGRDVVNAALSEMLLERGDLDEAVSYGQLSANSTCEAAALVASAQLLRAGAISSGEGVHDDLDVRLAIKDNNREVVEKWLASRDIPELAEDFDGSFYGHLTKAAALVAVGKAAEAAALASQLVRLTADAGRLLDHAEAQLLLAVALAGQGVQTESEAHCVQAMLYAQTGAFVRIFADLAPLASALVEQVLSREIEGLRTAYTDRLRKALALEVSQETMETSTENAKEEEVETAKDVPEALWETEETFGETQRSTDATEDADPNGETSDEGQEAVAQEEKCKTKRKSKAKE